MINSSNNGEGSFSASADRLKQEAYRYSEFMAHAGGVSSERRLALSFHKRQQLVSVNVAVERYFICCLQAADELAGRSKRDTAPFIDLWRSSLKSENKDALVEMQNSVARSYQQAFISSEVSADCMRRVSERVNKESIELDSEMRFATKALACVLHHAEKERIFREGEPFNENFTLSGNLNPSRDKF